MARRAAPPTSLQAGELWDAATVTCCWRWTAKDSSDRLQWYKEVPNPDLFGLGLGLLGLGLTWHIATSTLSPRMGHGIDQCIARGLGHYSRGPFGLQSLLLLTCCHGADRPNCLSQCVTLHLQACEERLEPGMSLYSSHGGTLSARSLKEHAMQLQELQRCSLRPRGGWVHAPTRVHAYRGVGRRRTREERAGAREQGEAGKRTGRRPASCAPAGATCARHNGRTNEEGREKLTVLSSQDTS